MCAYKHDIINITEYYLWDLYFSISNFSSSFSIILSLAIVYTGQLDLNFTLKADWGQ